ncbi:MAG TPA: AbrB/MazE/SpoVT family DNA-binding domain-containing protein [Thermoanaerobaculia bacterium]|nr:AbrB/MazE/SpoVT family DNA-binding domain-containing protein [Thermoanaerobaculia bacterium]
MARATLTSKGQVTIPQEIRQRLGLRHGDQLIFRFDERGRLIVEAAAPNLLGDLPGLLHHRAGKRPATVEEMDEAVRERAAKQFHRKTRR